MYISQSLKHSTQGDVHAVDPRGRTPLHLAVTLGHLESVRILLRHNALVNVENKDGWNGKLDLFPPLPLSTLDSNHDKNNQGLFNNCDNKPRICNDTSN